MIRFESEPDQGFTVIAEFSLANKNGASGLCSKRRVYHD